MSTYERYQEARDASWRALLCLKEKRLPVDAEALAHQMGVEVLPYPEKEEQPKLHALLEKAGGGTCVSLRIRGRWHIFLRRQRLDSGGQRFSVAHELGHLLLKHETRSLAPGVRALRSRENAGDLLEDTDDLEEYTADIFAVRLLAPACLLHELHIDTPGGVMRLCGLPPRAAALRAERMEVLNQRDAFFSHPLERQVWDAFLPYLREMCSSGQNAWEAPAPSAAERRPEIPEKGMANPPRIQPVIRPVPARKEKRSAKGFAWAAAAGILALALLLFFLLR